MSVDLHPDWEREPWHGTFERIYRSNGVPTDRYVRYIIGVAGGQRYCRTIEASGRTVEDGAAERNAHRIYGLVAKHGPAVCKLLIEGGDMPAEKEMPPLD